MRLKVFAKKLKSFSKKIIRRLLRVFFFFKNIRKELYYRSTCPEEVLARLDEALISLTPCRVVIEPWKGRHNVYAIFMLPIEDKSQKWLVVHIQEGETYCGGIERVGTGFEGLQAKPGYQLVKACLRTRTSTRLIVRGFGEQLKDPQNWRLINR